MAAGRGSAVRAASVGATRSIVYWRRDGGGDLDYLRPDHHTLSVYVEGGRGVRERANPGVRGGPGAICVLPAGRESRWFNDDHVGVLHVYFDDADLHALVGDALPLVPEPLHYGRDPLLHTLGRALVRDVDWSADADRLTVEQLVDAMLARLLARRGDARGRVAARAADGAGRRATGALSAPRLRRVERMLQVDAPACTLAELAGSVGLGVRQFARAYRAATGTTPGRRRLELRIEQARHLIRHGMPLADVAIEAGFSSQSHLTRRFREHVGMTPARWRAAWLGR